MSTCLSMSVSVQRPRQCLLTHTCSCRDIVINHEGMHHMVVFFSGFTEKGPNVIKKLPRHAKKFSHS